MSTKTGTHHDMHHHAGKHLVALQEWLHDDVYLPAYDYVFDWLFLGIPEHYPFKKKLMIFRANSKIGDTWDVVQLVLVVFTGITYAYTRYSLSFTQTSIIFLFELIITQFFMIDFLLNWYLAISMFHFFIDPMTLVDILTMIPVYVTLFTGLSNTSINFFRCLRIARLMRMFRTVKAIKNLNPVRRQVVNMVVTLMSMIYLAGSVIQLMEDDIFQLSLNCSYINANTGFKPSCSAYSFTTDNCDCTPNNCVAVYLYHDPEGQPSGIRCNVISFYQSIYFVVVTMATVGYGDFYPVTDYGRLVVIIFIIMSLVVIPTRLTELQRLLSMRSPYSMPYVKSHATDKHVVVCGHVNNSQKLERFFQEFFHEDHATVMGNEYHCVILSAREPPEDVRSLLSNPLYDNKVSFIVGSALNIDDLKKARCDISSCMFFLADMKADDGNSGSEDAATVLRALSVSNFNHELTCLVQVLRPEERVILKDSDISVILCLEEYKTALQARNAVCPGFSTIVENLFHSIETISDEDLDVLDIVWYREYLHGASLELYLMQLPKSFIIKMRYNYHRIVEGVYLKYNVVMLGLTCEDNSSIIFNPSRNDMDVFKHMKGMFKSFNIALVMAEDQHVANEISKELGDPEIQEQVLMCLEQAEKLFPCRGRAKTRKQEEAEEVVNEDPAPAPLTWSSKKTSPSSGLQQGLGLGILQEDEEAEDADSDDSIVELKQQVKGVKAVPMIKPTVLEENNNATNVTAALKNIMMSTLSKSEKNQLIALCSSVDNNVAAVINALATPDSPMDDDTLRSILMTHAPNGAVPSNSVFGNVVQSITNSSAAFNFLKTPPVFPSSPEKQNADDEITGVSRRVSASAVPIEDIDTDDLSSDANGFSDSDIDSGSERSSDEEEELNVGANGVKRKRYIGYKVVRKPKLTLPLLSNNINSRKSNASSAANTANGSDRNMSPSPGALQVVTETRLSGSSTSSNASGSNGPATSTVPATPSAPVKPNESKTMESCSFVTPAPQKQALVHSSSVPINDPNNSAWSNKTPRTNVPPHRLAPLSSSPGRATKRKKPLFTAPSALGPPLVLLSTQPKLDESGTPMKRPISAKGFRRVPEKGDSNKVGQSAHMDSSAGGTELDENVGAAEGDEGYSSAPPATIGTDRVQLPRPGQRPVSANVHTSVQASVDAPMRPKSAGPTPASARSPTGRVSIAELMSAPSCVDSNDESKESDDESELDDDDFVKTDGGSSEEEKLNSPKTATSTSTGTGAGISASAGPGTSVGTTTGGGISLAARKPFGLFSLNRLKAPAADAPALAVPAPVSAQRVASPNSLNSSDDGSISESSGDSDYESSECDDDVSVEEQEEDEEKLAGRAEWEKEYGRTSREVKMAKVKNHVILFGCDEHLPMFISELRREAVTGDSYHPILIVAEVPPIKWTSIMNRYNDIYFLRGDISSLDVFNKVNIEQAYSLIIMNVSGSSKNKSRGDQVVSVAVAKSSDDLSSGGLSEVSWLCLLFYSYI